MKLQNEINGLLIKVIQNLPAGTAAIMAGAMKKLQWQETSAWYSPCRKNFVLSMPNSVLI